MFSLYADHVISAVAVGQTKTNRPTQQNDSFTLGTGLSSALEGTSARYQRAAIRGRIEDGPENALVPEDLALSCSAGPWRWSGSEANHTRVGREVI